ncbi:MAG TPA: VTT domain-containing protein [Casimicrobiaceae bacterium]|nr:VTT domain-containing protein [Casimicrobiaceae bacterium]
MNEIFNQLEVHGSLLVGFNVLLQQLGLPIPAVPTMMIAGALTAMNRINGVATFTLSVGASLIADLIWFWAGRTYGYPVLRFLCKVSLSPDTCVRQTEGIFQKWGFFSVVVSKFVPGFSTVGPPIAGALRMPVGAFAVASLASASLWVGAAMGVGLIFSREIEVALTWMTNNAPLAAGGVGVVFALYLGYKGWQRWRLSRYVDSALISIPELRERMTQDPRPFVIDIGSNLAHQSRPHIPGAALLDLDQVASANDFPVDREIIVYCNCPNEASAKRAAQILLKKGLKSVRPLAGGLDAWVAAGHDVEHGIPIKIGKAPRAAGAD